MYVYVPYGLYANHPLLIKLGMVIIRLTLRRFYGLRASPQWNSKLICYSYGGIPVIM